MCSALLDDNALIANGLNGKLEIVGLQRQHVGLVVMPVYVADDVNGNDFEAVKAQLVRENTGDSGLHFLVLRDGTLHSPRPR